MNQTRSDVTGGSDAAVAGMPTKSSPASLPPEPTWDLVETQTCLKRLWTMAHDWHGIRVRYSDVLPALSLWVPPDQPWNSAEIILHEDMLSQPADAPHAGAEAIADVCSLAHELGRHIRYREHIADGVQLNGGFTEEEQVWRYAEHLLRAVGFTSWRAFHVRRDKHLLSVRRMSAGSGA